MQRSFGDTALKRRAREPAELQRRHRDGACEALAGAKARPGGETQLVSLLGVAKQTLLGDIKIARIPRSATVADRAAERS